MDDNTNPQAPVSPSGAPAVNPASPSGAPQVATEQKPPEGMATIPLKELERLRANAGRTSAAEKAKLKAEEKARRIAAGEVDDDTDPEKARLKEENENLQQQIVLGEVTRSVEDRLASSSLSEETKALIRQNPMLLADPDDLVTKNAKIIKLGIEAKIEELETVAASKKPDAPAEEKKAPEFTPGVTNAPPAPVADAYEEARKAKDVKGMILAALNKRAQAPKQ